MMGSSAAPTLESDQQMYVAGEWIAGRSASVVSNPYTGEPLSAVPEATREDAEVALEAAVEGARSMRALAAHERSAILHRAADLVEENQEQLAHLISLEEGKPLSEARGEAGRTPDLLRLCAFEGAQMRGETLPLDSTPQGVGFWGLTLHEPCGVLVAITPFNYPLLLVAHKLGPALAGGNAVILKPATQTPLTALAFTRLLLEAGLPPLALQCVTGSGSTLGPVLCSDKRVRKISFTGSTGVGEQITRITGVKRLSLELGGNCPLVVLNDADLDAVASETVTGGFWNAGQVCISAQRIIVEQSLYPDAVDAIATAVGEIRVGDPLSAETQLAAMVSTPEAERVLEWSREAVSEGAQLATGGEREGAVLTPIVVADAQPNMQIWTDEVFGPAVVVRPAGNLDQAIALANESAFGLSAGIFTNDFGAARKFAESVDTGTVIVNGSPMWRSDFMPYGGRGDSGFGKEGPRYALKEMTESKTVVLRPAPNQQ